MTDRNNNGPAFPRSESLYPDGTVSDSGELGMTLRDYFAAKAMQMHMAALSNWAAGSEDAWHAEASRQAYATADAMLKAREGGAA